MAACPSCGEANPERARFCLNCGAALSAEGAGERAHETRRRVTVLFADVAGSTNIGEQLDPEALREVMQRYFDAMRVAIERHAGTVEKFIGDAVMAVFGIPQLHEDDPLRAVRAAFDMQTSLERLNRDLRQRWGVELAIRTGINTGEVVAGDASVGQSLATGDVVNTAARLEQAAGSGEILIGPETYRLVRHVATAEAAAPLSLKGKAQPVPAWRLSSVEPVGAQSRRMDSPMVGRDRQLRILLDASERSREERAPQLVTVLGVAGVGKSRLVHEFLGRARSNATVIRGRCLSYGDAITYWPLSEALRDAVGIQSDAPSDTSIATIEALAGDVPQANVIAGRVGSALGLTSEEPGAVGSQEIFWAFRRLFEAMSRRKPLIAVFDDVQWGTPTFLDLLDHVADWSREAPILLVVIARPELLEVRPAWGGGKLNATTLLLEPLDDVSVGKILDNLVGRQALPSDLRNRIEEAAEGNPLFVEEFLFTLVDGGVLEREGEGYRVTTTPGEIPVPPTIELLLASRLDSLSPEERAVLARSSVIGKQFGAAEVQILSGPNAEPAIVQRLMGLVRKELLRIDEGSSEAELNEDVRFRFRHQLLRDAAYEGLPKHERARLHEAYGDWLEGHLGKRLEELREVVGFHLGQAAENRRDVAGNDEQARRLAARSAGHLEAAARRANAIGDSIAVIRLLQRANSLRPVDGVERVTNLPTLAGALLISGQIGEAAATLDEVLASPVATPETRAAALESIWVRFALGKGADDLRPGVEEALRIRREIGEPAGVARALDAMSRLEWFVGRLKRATALADEGLEYARQTGDIGLEASLRGARRLAFVFMRGVHRTEKLRLLDDELAFARANGLLAMQAQILDAQAIMTGQGGQRADAQALYEQAMTIRRDIGMRLHASASNIQATLDLWAGDFESAAVRLRTICRDLTAMGEKAFLSTAASDLAQALIDLGELNEAEEALRTAEEVGAGDDIATQVGIRAARARLLARRGRLSDAELTGQEAVAVAEAMDYADLLPAAQFALGDVRRLAGRMDEARSEWRAAIAGLDTIGNDLWAERLRKQLAEL